tara:strand:+ start:14252 stop:14443 length:192 start_codon:yes stop_codon:yes gene_type:complete
MKTKPIPLIPEDLLEAMDEKWPERCAELDWDIAQVMFYAGQRSVVRYLKEEFKDQREIQLRST